MFGTPIPHRRVAFGFPQYLDDLFFTEFALFRSSAALSFRSKTLPLSRPLFGSQAAQ